MKRLLKMLAFRPLRVLGRVGFCFTFEMFRRAVHVEAFAWRPSWNDFCICELLYVKYPQTCGPKFRRYGFSLTSNEGGLQYSVHVGKKSLCWILRGPIQRLPNQIY